MSLHKVRLERCERESETVWRLEGGEKRHLIKALRCYEGAMVEGLLPEAEGRKLSMRLERDVRGFFLRALEAFDEARESPVIVLLIGLLKSDQFDAVLKASAELGVGVLHPLICERSVPRMADAEQAIRKVRRWQRVLDEATKVSGSVFPPKISPPTCFDEFDFTRLPSPRYAALLCDDARPIGDVLRTEAMSEEVVLAVGPEGDWCDGEKDALLAAGFVPVGLGQRVLRASTAAIVGCGFLRLVRA